jgi:hypothetical protein
MTTLEKPKIFKTFHATVHVTRVEQWCVEAEIAADARERLLAGEGHRCHLGDCTALDVESVEE